MGRWCYHPCCSPTLRSGSSVADWRDPARRDPLQLWKLQGHLPLEAIELKKEQKREKQKKAAMLMRVTGNPKQRCFNESDRCGMTFQVSVERHALRVRGLVSGKYFSRTHCFCGARCGIKHPPISPIGCFDLTMGLDGTNIYFLFGCQVWPVFEVWYCWDGRATSVCSAPCSILRQCQGTAAICWKMWPPNKLPKFHIRPQISYQTKKRGKKSPSIFESTGMCFVTRPSSAVARTDHSRALMLIF